MDALSQIFEDIHFKKTEYLYIQAEGQWSFQLKQHSAVITHIVLFGELYIQLEHGESVHLKTGDMLIIPSGMQHMGHSESDHKLVEKIQLDDQFKGLRDDAIILGDPNLAANALVFTIRSSMDSVMAIPLINALPHYIHIQNALNAQQPEWLRIGLYFVANETQQNLSGRHKIMDHVVSIMLIECVREFIEQQRENQEFDQNWLNALTHPELSPAFTSIHGHPEMNWTVENLAELCFMSRSKFAALFNQIVGEPPLTYLKQHRLRLACQQLRLGQMPIQQIAHKVGYTSESAFSQAFKKQFNMTPSQYKENFNESNL